MISEVETAKYTAQHFQSMNMMNANENDKRFLIAASWWREWCDYTNFDLTQLQLKNQSQIHKESFTQKNKSLVGGMSSSHNNNANFNASDRSSQVNQSNLKKSEAETLEILYQNQNLVLKMDNRNKY